MKKLFLGLSLLSTSFFGLCVDAHAQDYKSYPGRYFFDVQKNDKVHFSQLSDKFKKLMPASSYKISYHYISDGVSGPIKKKGDYYYAFACQPHDCGDNSTVWVFNDSGNVWSSLKQHGGRDVFYGNPPREIIPLLTGNGS